MTIWVFSYLLFVHFTAQVTTFMTVSERNTPLRSYSDTLLDRFTPVVLGSGALHTLLQNSKPGTDLHNVYTKRFQGNPDSLVWSGKESHDRMLGDPNVVLFGVEASVYPGCYPVPLDWYVETPVGFGLQKGSEFTGVFDHLGLKMHESGILEKLKRRLRRKDIVVENEAIPLGIRELTIPFASLVAGGFIAGVLTIIEKSRFRSSSENYYLGAPNLA